MAISLRTLFLASLSVSVLALGACSTTGDPNMSDGAKRMDGILERAARDAKASGNKVETISLLEQIVQRNPKDPAASTALGQALREDDQLNRARQVLAPFATGEDAYPDAVMELAMTQLSLGQYKEAELTARRAVEMDPNSGRAFLALGTALDAQNYHEQAEVAFRRGIEKWKGDPAPIMNNLALNLASQNKLDQAIDMLNKAKELSPGRMELERNLRIITTLRETADEFTIKQQNAAAAPAPKKEAVKEPAKEPAKAAAKVEKAPAKKVEDVAEKQLEPKAKASPEKDEPAAAATNKRGSTQGFNTKSSTND